MLYGLSTRNVLRTSTFFNQDSLTTVTRGLRLIFHTSLCRHENYSKSCLAKDSNVISNKGEALLKSLFKRTSGLVQVFNDLLGFSEVQEAQSSVKKAENDLMNTRRQVQTTKLALYSVQERLREVRQKLDRVPRDDERYLALATEEHKILVEEKKMKTEHESLEALERDQFALLSGAVRNSHEKERLRAERTKHWSVIGSIGGAALGILGSTVVNYIRLKQIKNSIKETGTALIEKTDELTDLVKSQDGENIGIQATELKEFFSTQNQLLEQKLEQLGHILNFVTLNLASEPLKEFGIQIQPPGVNNTFGGGQPSAESQTQRNIKDIIEIVASKLDSITTGMKTNQRKMEDGFRALQLNLEKVENSVLQKAKKSTTGMELMELDKSNNNQTLPDSRVRQAVIDEYLDNNYWWMKANTCTTIICTVLTATILIYEIVK